jgi:hypothetical protein
MMPQLTHQNHFKFGYNNEWFNARKSVNDAWKVEYGRCNRPTGTFKEECLTTARQIKEDAGGKVTVLFSGGIDSEVALQSFYLAGIPVTASIMRFNNNLNQHDITYAVIACERMGIKYRFFDIDIIKFWENSLLEYASPVYCLSPQLIATMWLVDQIEEFPILGSGECLIMRDFPYGMRALGLLNINPRWNLLEKERIAAWYRHFMIKNRPGCPGFFQYTPEVILSYLEDPYVVKLTNTGRTILTSNKESKFATYQQHFELAGRKKYTGFEKVQEQDAYFRQILIKSFPGSDAIFKSSVEDLRKSMSHN